MIKLNYLPLVLLLSLAVSCTMTQPVYSEKPNIVLNSRTMYFTTCNEEMSDHVRQIFKGMQQLDSVTARQQFEKLLQSDQSKGQDLYAYLKCLTQRIPPLINSQKQ